MARHTACLLFSVCLLIAGLVLAIAAILTPAWQVGHVPQLDQNIQSGLWIHCENNPSLGTACTYSPSNADFRDSLELSRTLETNDGSRFSLQSPAFPNSDRRGFGTNSDSSFFRFPSFFGGGNSNVFGTNTDTSFLRTPAQGADFNNQNQFANQGQGFNGQNQGFNGQNFNGAVLNTNADTRHLVNPAFPYADRTDFYYDLSSRYLRTPVFFGFRHEGVLVMIALACLLSLVAIFSGCSAICCSKRCCPLFYIICVSLAIILSIAGMAIFVVNAQPFGVFGSSLVRNRFDVELKGEYQRHYGYSFYLEVAAILLWIIALITGILGTVFTFSKKSKKKRLSGPLLIPLDTITDGRKGSIPYFTTAIPYSSSSAHLNKYSDMAPIQNTWNGQLEFESKSVRNFTDDEELEPRHQRSYSYHNLDRTNRTASTRSRNRQLSYLDFGGTNSTRNQPVSLFDVEGNTIGRSRANSNIDLTSKKRAITPQSTYEVPHSQQIPYYFQGMEIDEQSVARSTPQSYAGMDLRYTHGGGNNSPYETAID